MYTYLPIIYNNYCDPKNMKCTKKDSYPSQTQFNKKNNQHKYAKRNSWTSFLFPQVEPLSPAVSYSVAALWSSMPLQSSTQIDCLKPRILGPVEHQKTSLWKIKIYKPQKQSKITSFTNQDFMVHVKVVFFFEHCSFEKKTTGKLDLPTSRSGVFFLTPAQLETEHDFCSSWNVMNYKQLGKNIVLTTNEASWEKMLGKLYNLTQPMDPEKKKFELYFPY